MMERGEALSCHKYNHAHVGVSVIRRVFVITFDGVRFVLSIKSEITELHYRGKP